MRKFGRDPLIRDPERFESAGVTMNDISIPTQLPLENNDTVLTSREL